MNIVIASGYFNPLTPAHIYYLKEAKEIGQKLIVILNNDKQVKLKKSIPFMNIWSRELILQHLTFIDVVYHSIDEDETICHSLVDIVAKGNSLVGLHDLYEPNPNFFFANGGDRFQPNEKELKVCEKNRIKIVLGVGGYNKVIGSSTYIEDAAKLWMEREKLTLAN